MLTKPTALVKEILFNFAEQMWSLRNDARQAHRLNDDQPDVDWNLLKCHILGKYVAEFQSVGSLRYLQTHVLRVDF